MSVKTSNAYGNISISDMAIAKVALAGGLGVLRNCRNRVAPFYGQPLRVIQ